MDTKQAQAELLLKQLATSSLFDAKGVSAFNFRMHLKLLGLRSGPTQGMYSWTSNAEGRWREEISFADYDEIRGGSMDTAWQQRTLNFRPLPAGLAMILVKNLQQLSIRHDEKVEKIRREHDGQVQCIELRYGNVGRRSICIDNAGLLARMEMSEMETVYEYERYSQLGGKRFPHLMRVVRHGKPLVEAEIEDLTVNSSIPDSAFLPPANAIVKPGCRLPEEGFPVQTVRPSYPWVERTQKRGGAVTVFFEVSSKGTVSNPMVIQTAGAELDEVVLSAIKQWRFAPYKCGNVAVDMETQLTMQFFIQEMN